VTVSVGLGQISLDGANGRSWGYDYRSLGLVDGISKSRRVQFTPGIFREFNPRFVWDSYTFLNFGSSIYDGPPHPMIRQTETIDFEFRIDVNTLSLDLNVGSRLGVAGRIAVGPRFQAGIYQDSNQTQIAGTQTAGAGGDVIDAKLCGLYGLGAWCSVDLAAMMQLDWPGVFRIFKPRLDAAFTYGRGDRLNYCWAEAFLQVLSSRSFPFAGGAVGIGPITGDVGYVWCSFAEGFQLGQADAHTTLTVGSTMIRGSLVFSF
jgi:hypothetical protein